MQFSTIGLAVVLPLIVVASLSAQSAVRELQDLVAARVVDVKPELEKRGYELAGVQRATEFWRKSNQCIRLGLDDGRVVKVVTATVTECDKVAANKPKTPQPTPALPPTPAPATQRSTPAATPAPAAQRADPSPVSSSPATTTGRVPASWLDRPLTNWNSVGQVVPRAPRPEEPLDAVASRCRLTKSGSTANERAVAAAGWIPFRPGGKQLVRNDVEVVGGMAGADGMCRPNQYNVFVFVAGRYAGSVSPTVMTSRLDGASGAIVVMRDTLTSEFLRYTDADPLCCPSSRVSASYRIDRSGRAPLLVPLSVSPVV
jgi:hypothetical protein